MNRHTFVYLFMSLMMVWLVFGALPLAAAETANAPVGVTETPTPAPTNTPTRAPTNMPTNTPTITPTRAPANTSVPTPANTPVPAPTNTPTAPAVVGVPNTGGNTGGAALQGGVSPWILVLVASVIGSLGALAFGLSFRAHRPTRR
ncbi:MAG: hypothetical protein NT169_00970 [Chloroflexi bacterium]|nr:hypothetical protein [Chloroflexota bacterium]